MKILAIETSCDETAVALLDISGPLESPVIEILGNSLFSQAKLHEEYGGVYPNLAKREHTKNLPILLEKVLAESTPLLTKERGWGEVDIISVTQGPGLEPALWVGITFAEELGKKWGKPVVPVNHMEGHIYSVLYRTESNLKSEILNPKSTLEMPAIALLVSGGHTELVYIKDFGEYEILGRTRDDAVGEAFDKVARMLGLPYPGGPAVSALAQEARDKGTKADLRLPRPMINSGDLDFSFSGLKTAVLYTVRKQDELTEESKCGLAREFEDAVVETLASKVRSALKSHPDARSLILGGGVAANARLRGELEAQRSELPAVSFRFPPPMLTTDNAIMIGIAAYVRAETRPELLKGTGPIEARGNLLLGSR